MVTVRLIVVPDIEHTRISNCLPNRKLNGLPIRRCVFALESYQQHTAMAVRGIFPRCISCVRECRFALVYFVLCAFLIERESERECL